MISNFYISVGAYLNKTPTELLDITYRELVLKYPHDQEGFAKPIIESEEYERFLENICENLKPENNPKVSFLQYYFLESELKKLNIDPNAKMTDDEISTLNKNFKIRLLTYNDPNFDAWFNCANNLTSALQDIVRGQHVSVESEILNDLFVNSLENVARSYTINLLIIALSNIKIFKTLYSLDLINGLITNEIEILRDLITLESFKFVIGQKKVDNYLHDRTASYPHLGLEVGYKITVEIEVFKILEREFVDQKYWRHILNLSLALNFEDLEFVNYCIENYRELIADELMLYITKDSKYLCQVTIYWLSYDGCVNNMLHIIAAKRKITYVELLVEIIGVMFPLETVDINPWLVCFMLKTNMFVIPGKADISKREFLLHIAHIRKAELSESDKEKIRNIMGIIGEGIHYEK